MTDQCKHEFDDDSFCVHCGKNFDEPSEAAVLEEPELVYQCPHCRFQFKELRAICENCGQTLPQDLEPQSAAEDMKEVIEVSYEPEVADVEPVEVVVEATGEEEVDSGDDTILPEADIEEVESNFVQGNSGSIPPSWQLTVSADPSLYTEPDEVKSQYPCPVGLADQVYDLSGNLYLVGRKAQNEPDISVHDAFVSRSHLYIAREDGGELHLISIKDDNPTNVNGNPVEANVRIRLNAGDVITIGGWTRINVGTVGDPAKA